MSYATGVQEVKLFFCSCLVFSSVVKPLSVWFFNRSLGKTASLQPIGTSLSKTATTVKFLNLRKLHFLVNFSQLYESKISILLRRSISFVKSSLVHTSFDPSSRVLFSCAWEQLKPPSYIFSKLNRKARSTLAAQFKLLWKWERVSCTIVASTFSLQLNWWLCISPVQVQKLRVIVGLRRTLL